MKKIMQIVVFLYLILDIVTADSECTNPFIAKIENPHRLYFGIDLSEITLDIPVVSPLRVKGSNFFGGFNLGYEYRSPEAFYFSTQFEVLGGEHGFKAFLDEKRVDFKHKDPGFGMLELQLGYTKQYGCWLMTPYAGIGGWWIKSDHSDTGFEETIGYFLFGLKMTYGFSEKWDLGFVLELFRSYHMIKEFKNDTVHAKSHLENPGAYFSLPATMRFGSFMQWDLQLEPYIRALSLGEKQLQYGARLNVGYSF